MDSTSWLPGAYRGGAEMSDAEYLRAAPSGVEWHYASPEDALDADHILVTGIDLLSNAECELLADTEPVVFLHHHVDSSAARRRLLESARVLMLHTPAHADLVKKWCEPRRIEFVLSAIDTSNITAADKQRFALVACRDHPLKGIKNARLWAARSGYQLIVMTREPRDVVLEAMSRAEVFVHLPLAFESEGRAVIEAVLSGCRIVTNEYVGVTSIPNWNDPARLRALVDDARDTYWRIVCE